MRVTFSGFFQQIFWIWWTWFSLQDKQKHLLTNDKDRSIGMQTRSKIVLYSPFLRLIPRSLRLGTIWERKFLAFEKTQPRVRPINNLVMKLEHHKWASLPPAFLSLSPSWTYRTFSYSQMRDLCVLHFFARPPLLLDTWQDHSCIVIWHMRGRQVIL